MLPSVTKTLSPKDENRDTLLSDVFECDQVDKKNVYYILNQPLTNLAFKKSHRSLFCLYIQLFCAC